MSRRVSRARAGWLLAWTLAAATACGADRDQDAPAAPARRDAAARAAQEAGDPELALLRSLTLDALGPPPTQPSNAVADDPRAAELGHRVFFDPGLSATGAVSCAHCHEPERYFTDGLARSRGVGQTGRNAPTVVGSAYAPWLFHDGRRDSLWSQALAPLESAEEMGLTRLEVVRRVAFAAETASLYAAVFGPPPAVARRPGIERAGPYGDRADQERWYRLSAHERRAIDRAFANVGKALEAYQRTLQPAPGRFDRYAEAALAGRADGASHLTPEESEGLRLFLDAGRTRCLQCHNGPLLTNQSFHHIGTAEDADGVQDFGRFLGVQAVLLDPFNCLGALSDAAPEDCGELRFLDRRNVDHETGKFKTPTLRGLAKTGPYMHDGRFATLAEVVDHYRRPPQTSPGELMPLDLDDAEAAALTAFLTTLGDEVAAPPRRLARPDS